MGRGRGNGSALYSGLVQDELRLLAALADIAANALHRATLYEQTRQRADQLMAVNTLGYMLAETLDLPQVYERLYDATLRLLPDSAAVFISAFDPARGLITCVFAAYEGKRLDLAAMPPAPLEPPGHGPQSEAIHTQRPLVVNDLQIRLKKAQTNISAGTPLPQSALYAPMVAKGQTLGVVQSETYRPNRYSVSDAELLALVANIAAVAIVNARLFKEAHRRLEHLQALRAIDISITTSRDLRTTLNILLDQITSQLEVDAAVILLLNPQTQRFEYAAGRGFHTDALQHTRLQLGESYAGRAIAHRRVIAVPHLETGTGELIRAPLLAHENFVAYFAAPLIAEGKAKGVMEIFHRSPLDPDREWQDFLEALAGQVAIAIDNATLFDDLQRSNMDLTLAYDATIEGWSRALDLRDKETEGHTQRVTEMTLRLARAMSLSEAALAHIRRGALLHDIGKMGIPDGILLKPGPLTDDEWVIMREHPRYAYDMLQPILFLREALDIPYCHHEKWDGTGYPRGLMGEQIPLAARLFAVVDVWDALRSDRPYRAGWPEGRVREHIRSLAGTHFDPQAVEAFLRVAHAETTGGPHN